MPITAKLLKRFILCLPSRLYPVTTEKTAMQSLRWHCSTIASKQKRGFKMNSALRKQILADRRRDRRNDIIASVIGWTVTIVGACIGSALFYAVTFTFLSIGL